MTVRILVDACGIPMNTLLDVLSEEKDVYNCVTYLDNIMFDIDIYKCHCEEVFQCD